MVLLNIYFSWHSDKRVWEIYLNVSKEVNSFIRRNNDHRQNELEKRKDVCYKFTRSDQLIYCIMNALK